MLHPDFEIKLTCTVKLFNYDTQIGFVINGFRSDAAVCIESNSERFSFTILTDTIPGVTLQEKMSRPSVWLSNTKGFRNLYKCFSLTRTLWKTNKSREHAPYCHESDTARKTCAPKTPIQRVLNHVSIPVTPSRCFYRGRHVFALGNINR